MEERLQKFLANSGIASRRKCEELILSGKICVNNKIVTELGTKINPEIDKVTYDGQTVEKNNQDFVYILLNKPIGVVTTVKDQFNRPTVLDVINGNVIEKNNRLCVNKKNNNVNFYHRIVPVGRLDMYTSGALILTNDGDFIYKLTHPKHEITKTYTVTLKGIISDDEVQKLHDGVKIDDYITRPAKVKILKTDFEKEISRLEITIHEGKNRQIRKMCEAVGRKVLALHRSKIGNIDVKNLKIGTWRYLKPSEIIQFKN